MNTTYSLIWGQCSDSIATTWSSCRWTRRSEHEQCGEKDFNQRTGIRYKNYNLRPRKCEIIHIRRQ